VRQRQLAFLHGRRGELQGGQDIVPVQVREVGEELGDGQPRGELEGCGDSVGILACAGAACAIGIVSLPAFTQVRGLIAANRVEPVSGFEPLTVRLQGQTR
jgi:hypothetical protein